MPAKKRDPHDDDEDEDLTKRLQRKDTPGPSKPKAGETEKANKIKFLTDGLDEKGKRGAWRVRGAMFRVSFKLFHDRQ